MPQSPVGHAEQTPVLCAIGIISPPTYIARREAIRQTWLADVPTAIAAKFVVRTGACASAFSSVQNSTTTVDVEQRDDMLLLDSICAHEPRSRGAVPSIMAWLRHAVAAYPSAPFIARTDDDVWLDLRSLHLYLDATARQAGPHVLMGTIYAANWIEQHGLREYERGFGHTCSQSWYAFLHLIQPWLRNTTVSRGAKSEGPFIFTPGYLTIMSRAIVAQLASSDALHDQIKERLEAGAHWSGEDIWLGSAMQRFGPRHPIQLVNLHGTYIVDEDGVRAKATTLLWHNRRKGVERTAILHNFSRHYTCLTAAHAGTSQPLQPIQLSCTAIQSPAQHLCSPAGSAMCTLSPLCEPKDYKLSYNASSGQSQWNLCDRILAGRICVPGNRSISTLRTLPDALSDV